MNSINSWQRCLLFKDTAEGFIKEPEEYIRFFDVTINGKLRHLVTYMPNKKGADLRILHTNIAEYLHTKYRQARSSYAYAKKKSFLKCVNQHLQGEVFLKTDIHSYFDSITYENLVKKLTNLHMSKEDKSILAQLVKACFYKNRLPLGFVSSPVISDLYLVSLDRKYEKNKSVSYTRYADDYIVSALGPDARKALVKFRLQLEQDLDQLDLELNRKKTYIRQLQAPGDAIHVLGVNIVRTDSGPNRITISDSYIRQTCKDLCSWFYKTDRKDCDEEFVKLYGRIAFIRQCSNSSFEKMKRMTKIKCGYSGKYTANVLKRTRLSVPYAHQEQ